MPAESRPELQQKLREFCREYALGNVRIYDLHAAVAADAGYAVSTKDHQETIKRLITRTVLGQPQFLVTRVTPKDALNEITWATAPVRDVQRR